MLNESPTDNGNKLEYHMQKSNPGFDWWDGGAAMRAELTTATKSTSGKEKKLDWDLRVKKEGTTLTPREKGEEVFQVYFF